MADNITNLSTNGANTFHGGMFKDNADMFIKEGMWNNAINAINNAHIGESGTLGNEQSNWLCQSVNPAHPNQFTIIGLIYKNATQWIVFSTNFAGEGEIGLLEMSTCKYAPIVGYQQDVNLGLNFSHRYLINGICKENYDCTWSVYFVDGHNPDRVLNIDNVPWQHTDVLVSGSTTCYEKQSTLVNGFTQLDCDAIRLHPLVQQPCLKLSKSQGSGQNNNGSYQAFIAYSENGIRLTDYSLPSNVQSIWTHTGVGGGLDVEVTNLDLDFEEYELVVVAVVNQQTIAKKIGNYSIRQNHVYLDAILQSLPTVDLSLLQLQKVIYPTSEKIFEVNRYLIRTSPTTEPYFNYQPQANQISAKWISVKYPKNYYYKGGNKTGYMRDEIYPFFIRWIYDTGMRTHSFHIPGRASKASDLVIQSAADFNIVNSNNNQMWQVYDTASITSYLSGTYTEDGGELVLEGDMAYWESKEYYPDNNAEVWNTNDPTHPELDLCGQHIRHHKMPSNETSHIHNIDTINIGTSTVNTECIYILGVKFLGIQPPIDSKGNLIPGIIGYEILRGSREGNRSVVAKGTFNNMLWYKHNDMEGNVDDYILYQNFPYNDQNINTFLSDDPNCIMLGGDDEDDSNRIGYDTDHVSKEFYSFHCPENNLVKPYLGDNYMKIYVEEVGKAKFHYQYPYKHPKGIIISNSLFDMALILGIGIGIMAAIGKSPTETETGISLIADEKTKPKRESGSASGIMDSLGSAINIAGLGGWIYGLITFISDFTFYAGSGTSELLNIIRNFTSPKNYALQINSVGNFNRYQSLTNNLATSRAIPNSMIKYIHSGVQDFTNGVRINNLYRNKYIALATNSELNLTNSDSSRNCRLDDIASYAKGYKDPTHLRFQQPISTYYGAIKVEYDNQYGKLESIIQLPISTGCGAQVVGSQPFDSEILFGGDIYINKYTEKNPFPFFNTWMFDQPDRTGFNYKDYVNIAYPRYWVNYNDFDINDLIFIDKTTGSSYDPSGQATNAPDTADLGSDDADSDGNITHTTGSTEDADKANSKSFLSRLMNGDLKLQSPIDFHRLDRTPEQSGDFIIKNSYMYLFCNGIRCFYTESELNMAFRDYGEDDTEKFYDVYGDSFSDVDYMFRSDKITVPIYYKYDLSLSIAKVYSNFSTWATVLPHDYSPSLYSSCFEYFPKRVIYSLQQQDGMKRDNWRNFLPLNYHDFVSKINCIKKLNATGALILYEGAEPLMFVGQDQLQTTSGVKVTIGDGGLFNSAMQSLVNADDEFEYGSSNSMRGVVNTPYGAFWISQQTGKILQTSGQGIEEISKNGMKFWFADNLPSDVLKAYPDYPFYDNPIMGIGCQAVYDPTYELLYFTKKDYILPDGLDVDENGFYTQEIITTTIPGHTDTRCPVGYDLVDGVCTKCTTTPAIHNLVTTLTTHTPYSGYGFFGTKIYQVYDNHGTDIGVGSMIATVVTSVPFWKPDLTLPSSQVAQLNNGPVNRLALWGVASDGIIRNNYNSGYVPPIQKWIGFKTCIDMPLTQTYYIGLAADNSFRLIIDGVTIIQTYLGSIYTNFQHFHIYPIMLTTGVHTIVVEGWNDGGQACFGCEIYNNTMGELIAATSYDTLNVLFTTREQTQFTSDAYYCGHDRLSPTWIDCETPVCQECLTTDQETYITPPTTVEHLENVYVPIAEIEQNEPIRWTISYDPKIKQWISFHDWSPGLFMQGKDHFYTTKTHEIWKHNDDFTSYNNYYGVDYGWEVDYPAYDKEGVSTMRSIEYRLEVLKYHTNGVDTYHILDANFDQTVIYNSEQISGTLNLIPTPKNLPVSILGYPKNNPLVNPTSFDILYSKEENVYRFNQFWDITKDRGEYTNPTGAVVSNLWSTNINGYRKIINLANVNYSKILPERKKFRHYRNNILLRKSAVPQDSKMILKLTVNKNLKSLR